MRNWDWQLQVVIWIKPGKKKYLTNITYFFPTQLKEPVPFMQGKAYYEHQYNKIPFAARSFEKKNGSSILNNNVFLVLGTFIWQN